MVLKKCNKCKEEKNIEYFHNNKTRKDGKDTWCISCSNEYNIKYYAENKELKKEASKMRSRKHRKKAEECALTYFNTRVSKCTEFTFLGTDLLKMYENTPKCPYCGRIFESHMEVEIEHKIPKSRGGTSELFNITLSCGNCNRLKYMMTDEEFNIFLID